MTNNVQIKLIIEITVCHIKNDKNMSFGILGCCVEIIVLRETTKKDCKE